MTKSHPHRDLARTCCALMPTRFLVKVGAAVLLLSTALVGNMSVSTHAVADDCNTLKWRRDRPYDFYSAETRITTGSFKGGLLHVVEKYHFNDNVKALKKGQSAYLPADLDFILSTIPNHPRALDLYSTYQQRYKTSKNFREERYTRKPRYTADCLFDRAVKVYPDHGETWMVWGIHLHRLTDYQGAVERYKRAISLGYATAPLHNNLGLSYFELGQYAAADKHERIASKLGYPLKGLRSKLNKQAQAKTPDTNNLPVENTSKATHNTTEILEND